MSAPTTAPVYVDQNGTNQSPEVPSGVQSDGFQEMQIVPNSWWNYLFKNWVDWLRWLRGSSVLLHADASEGDPTAKDVPAGTSEEVLRTFVLPAGTFTAANVGRLRVRATYDVQDLGPATAVELRVRIGGLGGEVLSNYSLTSWGGDTTGQIDLESTLTGSASGSGFVGNSTDRTSARHGTGPADFEHNVDFNYNPSINTTVARDIVVTVQCATASVTTAYVSQFEVEFAHLP